MPSRYDLDTQRLKIIRSGFFPACVECCRHQKDVSQALYIIERGSRIADEGVDGESLDS